MDPEVIEELKEKQNSIKTTSEEEVKEVEHNLKGQTGYVMLLN